MMRKVKRKIKKFTRSTAAFTLLELLVVIAVIGILATVMMSSIGVSRARAEDVKTKAVLSSVRTTAQNDAILQGSFQTICSSGSDVHAVISTLASQKGLSSDEYSCMATTDQFAVIFPLKAETGYWCVDATGSATVVSGLDINGSPAYSCGVISASSNASPTIVLNGPNPDSTPFYGTYPDPGYSASDPEDGNITSSVTKTTVLVESQPEIYCSPFHHRITYSVTDSDGNTATAVRIATGDQVDRECPAEPID